jgi:hypothetical protein
MANTPSPPGSTRQLLDELDALMQRMLALPVEQEDDAAPAPERTKTPVADGPAEKSAAPEAAELPAPQTVALAVSPLPPPSGGEGPPPPSSKGEGERAPAPPPRQDGPELPAGPHGLTPLGSEVFATLTTPTPFRPRPTAPRPVTRRAASANGVLFWPVRGLNYAFDRVTHRLGAPGRWLRGRRGRAVLGWVGIALLMGALGWQMLLWLSQGW